MSVYKPEKSPYYHYDFQIQRSRFHGSTGRKNRREAEAVERAEREKAREFLKVASAGVEALTLDLAAGRYWHEVGQHYVNAATTWTDLERLVGEVSKDKLLTDITDNDVAGLVARRRSHRVKGRKDAPLISAATVNRSTVQVLQAIFTRAKQNWHVRFDHEPDWKKHRLPEEGDRVRELHGDQAERLYATIRDDDYGPFIDFAHTSGQRLKECILRWSEVNWEAEQIVKTGKQGRRIVIPITTAIREIIWPLQGDDAEFVFTYVAKRTRDGRVKGRRYPITYNGIKTHWKRRIRKAANLTGVRFHDLRHDFASKVLRKTGNLKLVSKALNHADIKTTMKYAHVLDDDVRLALEQHQKSRKKSRSKLREAS